MNKSKSYLKKNITILLTSAGGLTGIFLSKHLAKRKGYRIIAIDMSEINPLGKWVDKFFVVPSNKHSSFLSRINEIIISEKVDIMIPITSYDIEYFSKSDIQSELQDVRMIIMDYDKHIELHNKEKCYHILSKQGISTPKVYNTKRDLVFPSIIKPLESSGSRNTVILYNERDYDYWTQKYDNFVVTEFLEGAEFTVDCLFDETGKCLGANVRERVKSAGGGAVVTKNSNYINVDFIIERLENLGFVKGPVNFQFKQRNNGELCIFDFNTRFASGGLPLAIESGFDIPALLIELLLNGEVQQWKPSLDKDGLTMVRYYDEYFTYK